MTITPQAIVLFSGGLDSILAAKVLQDQGLTVRCLHCCSPFFGSEASLPRWRRLYDLDIVGLDVSRDFSELLSRRPAHGFGKVLNPCVDCKILLLRHARLYMEEVGALFLATGEVLGQRPMSQRRDTLQIIPREAGVTDLLLRPLCAQHLQPTAAERSGLVDRSRLLGFSGRGRTQQLELARQYGLKEIPTPGGGCKLTERENARRYWPVLKRRGGATEQGWGCCTDAALPEALAQDFALANLGRQFWAEQDGTAYWLSIGRNNMDNKKLDAAASPEDALISLCSLPGPLALARGGAHWPRPLLEAAAAFTASYAPKAVAQGTSIAMQAAWPGHEESLTVLPCRDDFWGEPSWPEVKEEIRQEARARLGLQPKATDGKSR